MKTEYATKSHCKYRLTAHIIFVVKYRKNLLNVYGDEIKALLLKSSENKRFKITQMEVDLNHIHLLVDFEPSCSIGYIVKTLKAYSTTHIWQSHPELNEHFLEKKNILDTRVFCMHGWRCFKNNSTTLYRKPRIAKFIY